MLRIVAVFHGSKVEGLGDVPTEIGVNPPMTVPGMVKIRSLLELIKSKGPYNGFHVSRLARALDAASVIALELDMDFKTMTDLGQLGNKDGDKVIMWPGHENDGCEIWQKQGLDAVAKIFGNPHWMDDTTGTTLVVSHRPIIGGLVAAALGITDEAGIKAIVHDPALTKDGLVIFETTDGHNLKIVPLT